MGAPTFDFSGQAVLVTGGRRGVKAGIVTAFLAAGASVMTCGRPVEGGEGEVEGTVEVEGAAFVTADIRQTEQARLAVDTAVERFGRLDVLVNVAGDSPPITAPASPQTDESVVVGGLLAPFYCAQAAQPIMAGQAEGGAIVNVACVSGLRPSAGTSAYGAANAGLISLSSTLAVEWAPLIRVACVTVHLLETGAEGEVDVGPEESALGADVASACLFLASPAATFVTGAHLVVPGGGGWPRYLTAQGQA